MIQRNLAQKQGSVSNLFGNRMGVTTADEREQADVYANFGYATGDPKYPFVSCFGIGIDTLKPKELRGDDDYRAFVAAGNELLAEVQAAAAELAPGESTILIYDPDQKIAIQLRRREAKNNTPPAPENNRFSRRAEMVSAG